MDDHRTNECNVVLLIVAAQTRKIGQAAKRRNPREHGIGLVL